MKEKGYDVRVILDKVKNEIKEISCTCMWSTMEMSRHKDYHKRKPCKHIKLVKEKFKWLDLKG